MKIRNVTRKDLPSLQEIFHKQGIPKECFPDVYIEHKGMEIPNPRFIIKKLVEQDSGQIAMAGFLKITSEAFLLLDHSIESPLWRWERLKELVKVVSEDAKLQGIDVITAWVPNDLTDSFGPRLEGLGFVKSPWQSFSLLL